MSTQQIRSPIPWIGGKYYSRERILKAFPHPSSYKTYVEPFCGACHVILTKPPYNHLEVINDFSGDLVNFWMQCRNHPEELQQHIDSLPYARSLYEEWQASLFDETPMNDMERATRWFYVLRSATSGLVRKAGGNWAHKTKRSDFDDDPANIIHKAVELLAVVSDRFQRIQIEHRDFADIIRIYGHSYTMLYCDPPYIGTEFYYEGVPPFTLADHERLAQALNNTPAQVALSYYPHEALNDWYPAYKWRRISWQTYKHAEKTRETRQTATEMLLMNYPAPANLWQEESEGVA